MRRQKIKEVKYLPRFMQKEAMLDFKAHALLLLVLTVHSLELPCLVQRPKHHSLIHSFIHSFIHEYLLSAYIMLSTVLIAGNIIVKKAHT